MERLTGVLADQVRMLSEWFLVTLVHIKGVGKLSVFHHDESKFCKWTHKIQDYQIGLEPQLEVMLGWALENEIEIRMSMIAHKFGDDADPTEHAEAYAQIVVRLKTVLAHLTEGVNWPTVQNCGRKVFNVDRRQRLESVSRDNGATARQDG